MSSIVIPHLLKGFISFRVSTLRTHVVNPINFNNLKSLSFRMKYYNKNHHISKSPKYSRYISRVSKDINTFK